MNIRCPWCEAHIEYDETQEGAKCPECGGIVQAVGGFKFKGAEADRQPGNPTSRPVVASKVAMLSPTSGPSDSRTIRLNKIKALREISPWSGTRTFFGFLAVVGVIFGSVPVVVGVVASMANQANGQATLVSGISLILGPTSMWLVVCLMADIADLLLKSGED